MSSTHDVSPASRERGHEQSDLSTRMLFLGLLVLVVVTTVSVFAMVAMFGALDDRQVERTRATSPLVETDITPPEPRLENTPREVRDRIDALRTMQESSYTWLDREAGVARIPVERAMAILAEAGLPHRAQEADE